MTGPDTTAGSSVWRMAHARSGDEAIAVAHGVLSGLNMASNDEVTVGLVHAAAAYAAIAQAHYLAAQVRRP